MRKNLVRGLSWSLAAVVLVAVAASHAAAGTLDDVRKRGQLSCGINTGLPGFAFTDDKATGPGSTWPTARPLPRP